MYNHFETARKRTVAHTRDTRRVTRMGQERTRDGTTTRARWIWVRLLPLKSRDGMFGPVANPFVPLRRTFAPPLDFFVPLVLFFSFGAFRVKTASDDIPIHHSHSLGLFHNGKGEKFSTIHSFPSFLSFSNFKGQNQNYLQAAEDGINSSTGAG